MPANAWPMAPPWSSWPSTKPVRPTPGTARSRFASAPIISSCPSASRRRTSSSIPTSSPSRRGSRSIIITAWTLSRRAARSGSAARMPISRAGSPTSPSPSAATNRCAGRCTASSSTTRFPPGSTWRSSMRASSTSMTRSIPRCARRARMCCSTPIPKPAIVSSRSRNPSRARMPRPKRRRRNGAAGLSPSVWNMRWSRASTCMWWRIRRRPASPPPSRSR